MIPYRPTGMQDFVGVPQPPPDDAVWSQAMEPMQAPQTAPTQPTPSAYEIQKKKSIDYGTAGLVSDEERFAIQQALADTVKESISRGRAYQEREDDDDQNTRPL
jgi:hypothetical protein